MADKFAEHYVGNVISQLDSIFYFSHLLMTSIHKRVLVTEREQLVFEVAIIVLAAILLTKVFYRSLYNRWRSVLVLICHLIFTTLRAAAVHTMAFRMAVHWRSPSNVVRNNKDNAAVFIASVLSCLGGPFRLFEMLGLQQPFAGHVIVSVYYLVLHTIAASKGSRLTYSNALFYLVHEVNDGLNGVVETLLDALLPLPISSQATCSSCPGVALYSTLLLYGSVAVPLYVTRCVEQAAKRRFHQRMAADAPDGHAAQQQQQQQQQQPQPGTSAAAAQQQQQHQEPSTTGGADAVGSEPELAVVACAQPSRPLALCVHCLVLLALLLLCWLVSNFIALVLLPRVLTSQQLAFWCPNRPYVPYVIAGEVYPADA